MEDAHLGESVSFSGIEYMASVTAVPASGFRDGVDRLPDEMNDMKIRDDKVEYAFV